MGSPENWQRLTCGQLKPVLTLRSEANYLMVRFVFKLGEKELMVCKGICIRHEIHTAAGQPRYVNGQKRCQVCAVYMIWTAATCPCCGIKLRTKFRNYKSRTASQLR
jgi:hypothetical protein